MGRWSRSGWELLPAGFLLVAVAVHAAGIVGHDEDPQRGSAFAMFATPDVASTRRVHVTTGPGDVELEVPAALHDRVAGLADSPRVEDARDLARDLLDLGGSVVRVRVVTVDGDGRAVARRVLLDVTEERDAR